MTLPRWRNLTLRAAVALGCLLSGGGAIADGAPVAGPEADPSRQVLVTVANPTSSSIARAGTTRKGYDGATRYVVSPIAKKRASQIEESHHLHRVAEWPITALGVHCIVFEVPVDATRDEVLAELRADPHVESAQPMQTFATRTEVYDDPYFGLQSGLTAMDIEGAHLRSLGERVRVAIIDTGVDTTHPELSGRVGDNVDLVGDSRAPPPAEQHGTAVAGVIGAIANNGQGIVGVAPQAHLLALRACWQTTREDGARIATCNSFTLARALGRAIDDRASVINLSLGGPQDSLLERLVVRAIDDGAIVVGARPEDPIARNGFPASVPGVIAVDSAEASDPDSGICAPGRDVLTLRPHGGYDFDSGSSLAAAQVSGVVALLRARNQRLTAADALRLLKDSHESVSRPGCMVNACAALATMLRASPCDPTAPRTEGLAQTQKTQK
jgi:subtilisin family serine protease